MRNFFRNLFNLDESIDETLSTTVEVEAEPEVEAAPATPTVGDILKATGLRVVHFRPNEELAQVGIGSPLSTTVVYQPRRDGKHTIQVATAVCSANDVYDKRFGTQLALHRFLSGQTVALPPSRDIDEDDYSLLFGYFG